MTTAERTIIEMIETELICSMFIAMVKQDCPDSTPMLGFDITLGEFKKIIKVKPHELEAIKRDTINL